VQHDDRVLLSGRRRQTLLLTGTLALAASVTAGISGWVHVADPTEPVPPRADAYSTVEDFADLRWQEPADVKTGGHGGRRGRAAQAPTRHRPL
jgi:hypothetical protein